jgi:hypothetical protein
MQVTAQLVALPNATDASPDLSVMTIAVASSTTVGDAPQGSIEVGSDTKITAMVTSWDVSASTLQASLRTFLGISTVSVAKGR